MRLVLLFLTLFCGSAHGQIKVLIVDGQNNHSEWPKITYMLKAYLEESGGFKVDVARCHYTWNGEDFLQSFAVSGLPETEAKKEPHQDLNYKPDFKKYDVVVSNFGWNAAPWPQETQKEFEDFIQKGGGLVVIHAADNSFPNWEAYNEMIGLGGWGDRTEKDGPYVYYDKGNNLKHDFSPGAAGSHGQQHEYTIKLRKPLHPITKGMPLEWLHTKDELYDRLRGPAINMEILATAFSDSTTGGTGRHEPILMTINYGKGRIFHTPMGHATEAAECVGFKTVVLRGTEWAATGKVSSKIPKNFPTRTQSSRLEFKK